MSDSKYSFDAERRLAQENIEYQTSNIEYRKPICDDGGPSQFGMKCGLDFGSFPVSAKKFLSRGLVVPVKAPGAFESDTKCNGYGKKIVRGG